MATTNQQRAQCVLWYAKFESVKRVQREFRREYGVRNVPKCDSIMLWYRTFAETGFMLKEHASGRSRNPVREEAISEAMTRSPTKSLRQLEEDDNMDIVFQQDGAPPHWAWEVRNFLNATFNGMWCGRGGPISWPLNSPDHTPMDFFVWGFVKDTVYAQKPRNINDLREKITQAFQQITPLMLQRTWAELNHRYEFCRERNGGHVED